MRITGGSLRSRSFKVPPCGVRPAQDRVREAVFSMIGERVAGSYVLDLFAGSGAYGLEAWSRAAESVTWVENHVGTYRVLKENVTGLCGADPSARCLRQDAYAFLKRSPGPFDLIFADPPYREPEETLEAGLFNPLSGSGLFNPGGLLILERPKKSETPAPDGWEILRNKTYGQSRILIYTATGI